MTNDLILQIEKHLRQLAPHVAAREGTRLLREALAALQAQRTGPSIPKPEGCVFFMHPEDPALRLFDGQLVYIQRTVAPST